MMTRLLFLFLLVTLPSLKSTACSCFGPPTFCGPRWITLSQPGVVDPDAVVLGVKVGVLAHGRRAHILQVFSGPVQVDDTLRVWGDTGLPAACTATPGRWAIR